MTRFVSIQRDAVRMRVMFHELTFAASRRVLFAPTVMIWSDKAPSDLMIL
jgi:hypothetical protein